MKQLYDKSKLAFTLVGIGAYVVLFSLADKLSLRLGKSKIVTAPLGIAFVLLLVIFFLRNKLCKEHGLCKFSGNYKGFLFFLPMLPILYLYLWRGVSWDGSSLVAVLSAVSMLCVGVIEEILFRGLLFTTLKKDNIKLAVLISSLSFGMGHIMNLLNGRALLSTLLQVCYASALGFMLTMIFYKGKSLLPCIILHSALNVISVFNGSGTTIQKVITSLVLCALAAGYGLWIWKMSNGKKVDAIEKV